MVDSYAIIAVVAHLFKQRRSLPHEQRSSVQGSLGRKEHARWLSAYMQRRGLSAFRCNQGRRRGQAIGGALCISQKMGGGASPTLTRAKTFPRAGNCDTATCQR